VMGQFKSRTFGELEKSAGLSVDPIDSYITIFLGLSVSTAPPELHLGDTDTTNLAIQIALLIGFSVLLHLKLQLGIVNTQSTKSGRSPQAALERPTWSVGQRTCA